MEDEQAHWEDLICIENAKIKNWTKSSPGKIINLGDDFVQNAKFALMLSIKSSQWKKCFFQKMVMRGIGGGKKSKMPLILNQIWKKLT